MELEFDKEIDALLRKARPPGVGPAGGHLDADIISAFAEGAVPAAARNAYTAHFADCDRCRKALSQVTLLNEPLAAKAVALAAAPAAASTVTARIPWYRSLFRSPGLAAAMGILVITFGGALVYLVTQRGRLSESNVAMEPSKAASNVAIPYTGIDSASNANAAALSNSTSTATTSNTMSSAARTTSNSAANTSIAAPATKVPGAVAGTSAGLAAAQPPPAAAAAPPADLPINGRRLDVFAAEKPKTQIDGRDQKDEDKREVAKNRVVEQDSLARSEMTARKSVEAPGGLAGPQNQVEARNAAVNPVIRKIGSKTFRNSNGVWYDSAYHGQPTTNVGRGTGEFNKLDSGLRSIANQLSGVVIAVWKDKAFRIQ